MLRSKAWLAAGGFLIALSGCGDENSGARSTEPPGGQPERRQRVERSIYGMPYRVVRSPALVLVPNGLEGRGSVVFETPLARREQSFDLGFRLEKGGSITWVGYSDPELRGGIEVRALRSGDDVSVRVRNPEGDELTLEEPFKQVNASKSLHLAVDVYPDRDRMVLWLNGERAVAGFAGRGRGMHWGITVNDARLVSASAEPAPSFPEESSGEDSEIAPPDPEEGEGGDNGGDQEILPGPEAR